MSLILAAAVSIVFHRPADCARPCDAFAQSVAHPAMQRRLTAVSASFETAAEPAGTKAALAVVDPAGKEVKRWTAIPNWLMLSDILTLVELASAHIVESSRAEPAVAERELALALLALGDKPRGRALLETMRTSESAENRQLAAIWLQRVDKTAREESLARAAREATTERVRIEAWMALGDTRLEQQRFPEAIAAYDRAVSLAKHHPNSLQNARIARQRAAELATPVSGLEGLVAGKKSIQPRNVPKNTSRVEYRLGGKLVATAKRKPFVAAIQFPRVPTRQILEVTARNRGGATLQRWRVVVNERSEAFEVTIVEPSTTDVSGNVDVAVETRVPQGRTVDRLDIEWNGNRVARLTAPPYRARVNAGSGEAGMLRAVLRLDDGSEAEDVLLTNSGEPYEAEAHIVEVPAYFDEDAKNVTVRENGKKREIERILSPTEAPLLLGLLIDESSSMAETMLDVQEAAIRFLGQTLQDRDQAMVVSFSGNVRVAQHATSDRRLLERAILSLRPRGSTALHDAIITGLLQLQSTGSRKALVVFSDGLDAVSAFSSADVAEVARRVGVPVYVLVFNLEQAAELKELSTRSGGKWFDVASLDQLGDVFGAIGSDLRRQSLVIYRTDTAGTEWRTLELLANGKAVRAPAGVYVSGAH